MILPSTVSLPSELVESSTDCDVGLSLGFTCSLEFCSLKRDKRSNEKIKLEKCIVTLIIKINNKSVLKLNSEIKKPFIFQKHFENKMYLVGKKQLIKYI